MLDVLPKWLTLDGLANFAKNAPLQAGLALGASATLIAWGLGLLPNDPYAFALLILDVFAAAFLLTHVAANRMSRWQASSRRRLAKSYLLLSYDAQVFLTTMYRRNQNSVWISAITDPSIQELRDYGYVRITNGDNNRRHLVILTDAAHDELKHRARRSELLDLKSVVCAFAGSERV